MDWPDWVLIPVWLSTLLGAVMLSKEVKARFL